MFLSSPGFSVKVGQKGGGDGEWIVTHYVILDDLI